MATYVDVIGPKYLERVSENVITSTEGKSLVPAFAGRPPDKVKELAAMWEVWVKRANVLPYLPIRNKKD